MDILEKFLRGVSYKFPKGYPENTVEDLNNVLVLIQEKLGLKNLISYLKLNEVFLTKHYKERLDERGNIRGIILTSKMLGEYSTDEVKAKLIPYIENALQERSIELSKLDMLKSTTKDIIYILLEPQLKNKTTKHKLTIKAQSSKNNTIKEDQGHYYYSIIKGNEATTLILSDDSFQDAKEKALSRNRREGSDKEVEILKSPTYELIIDLDELMIGQKYKSEENKIDPETLPYSPKSEYRKGAKFIHSQYGEGKITTTSAGHTGKGDSRGILSWVEVDFGKPYVNAGKFMTTRKINNVYTSWSPRIKNN